MIPVDWAVNKTFLYTLTGNQDKLQCKIVNKALVKPSVLQSGIHICNLILYSAELTCIWVRINVHK